MDATTIGSELRGYYGKLVQLETGHTSNLGHEHCG